MNLNPWIWRAIIILLAVAFVPLIVSAVASLVTQGIHSVTESVQYALKPLSQSGEPRLQGIIKLCLYLITTTLLVKALKNIK